MYLITSSVGTYGNRPKTTSTENIHLSVLFDEKMRSIGHQMRSQACLISVSGLYFCVL